MPFLFNGAIKRRKDAAATNAWSPEPSSSPPSYPFNAITALGHQPQWTPQADPHSALLPAYTAASLPVRNHEIYPDNRLEALQPHHTWSHPQTSHFTLSTSSRADLHARIEDKLGDVISLIDEEAFNGSERDLEILLPESPAPEYSEIYSPERDIHKTNARQQDARSKPKKSGQDKHVNVFSKTDLYMNSRLPATLPPLRVYIPTYPLLCLAAQYSASAYLPPKSPSERKDFVSADNRQSTKAMLIKSIPCDDKKTIVFAIRGTSMLSLRDWGVNFSTDAVSPAGFLDDQGNLCHSGFLKVAKAMVKPIAARLRQLLEENPNRSSCSLLMTGHSAGGAVASLLYTHMLASTVQSDLNILTGCFKRVHCVTFGAPPISLLPLQKPDHADGRLRKCLFHSFINEGDPVARAERAYVRSLVDLLSKPVPSMPVGKDTTSPLTTLGASKSRLDLSLPKICSKPKKTLVPTRSLWWPVPPATFSNAGRLVVLRVPDAGTENNVTASVVTDEQLRQVMFGDPVAHSMDLYASRIETLAVRAVTGRAGAC
ncbi:Alpha/Beta hydrolase protein [Exophiala viscosa]|uniref:Alpha/Beta hydrolase protein n=1 Tax=Exophiala viscosa TaxID=2486360 RepID=UPI0021A21405|nr:Alpha/Beta hydrolase protein [Exophiala viscosa]